jgi:hypothetical protein
MKKSKFIFAFPLSLLPVLFLLVVTSCSEKYLEDQHEPNAVSSGKTVQLIEILNQLNLESDIVIVPKECSIQDAINASQPGSSIYIEPGIYNEKIVINKQGIKLIGLCNSPEEKVILENPPDAEKNIAATLDGNTAEIANIQFNNFPEKSIGVTKLECSGKGTKNPVIKMSRVELGNRIAHYTYEVRLGTHEFDVVRIHRVVREQNPNHPVRVRGDIFMVHGSIQDFDDIFLTAGAEDLNVKTSLPVYLASKNVDVWGIDLAWTLVPSETTNFTFMKDWGIERDINHTLIAMSFARLIRGFTIGNFDKMNLLGFSYGVQVAFGAAGAETQIPKVLRNVKGIIPVDAIMKYSPDDEEYRENACNIAAGIKESIDKGIYQYDAGVTFQLLGNMALTAPDDPSPIPDFAGMTNKQVMLFMGTMTYLTGSPDAPFEHFVGGDLNDLYYTDSKRWLRLAVSLAPYQPQLQMYEFYTCMGNQENVSFDDHLAEITLPILYLGAGGGGGSMGEYTGILTTSTDITHYIASVNENRAIDYGHADLFLGRDADVLVWQVLYNWLISHSASHKW